MDDEQATPPKGDDWSLEEYRKPLPKPSEALPPPRRVGRYLIEDSLGHGGMGIVYLARHPITKQRVALKVMLSQQANAQTIGNFLQEIRLLARFNHPRIATIFDADTFESGGGPRPYFTMQYIDGAKAVADYARDARCSHERRLELVLQAVSAVAAAHRLDVIHGDIKPSNALVGLDGDLRVVDFGASIDAAVPAVAIRALSPTYAAPEQRNELRVVKQSDVYSLAVLAYEVLAGRLPFAESDAGGDRGSALPIRRLLPKAGRKLERVLLRALSERPENRYSDAEGFQRDLNAAIRGGLLEIDKPHSVGDRAVAFCAEHRSPVMAAAAVFAALTVGMIGTVWQSLEARRQAAEALRASIRAEALAEAESAAREQAELAGQREREARQRIEKLKQSTDNAILFVPKLLEAVNYNVPGETLSISSILDSAEAPLSELGEGTRLSAIAHRTLGRIASNWGQYERGARLLNRSVQIWDEFAKDESIHLDEKEDRLYQHSQALNFLAWALLGDARQKQGLRDRAIRAEEPAQKGFLLRKEMAGAGNDSTLCFQADWLRMRLLAGDQLGSVMGFTDLMAAAAGQDATSFIGALRGALNDVARLAQEGKSKEAMRRAREFLAPFLSADRPRLRVRLPWSFAQANEELPSLPLVLRTALGLSESEIVALRPPMAKLALELAEEIHPGDKMSIELVKKAMERVNASLVVK
jgi:tRNA A-37 threonylcarbamoyl transferase component Bud32